MRVSLSLKYRIFLTVSVAMLLLDAAFVAINHRAAQQALHEALAVEGHAMRSTAEVTIDTTLVNMLQLATFVANDPHLQETFLAGKLAVEAEGGGPGGARAAAARNALFEQVAPGWSEMTANFDVRQLHFHIGPGSLSFLRVHTPGRYGDRMDDLRHIIVETNRNLTTHRGFETGRVYSGLRGVVPMFAADPSGGERIHLGAVEVGTSFTTILDVLDKRLGSGVAVLLQRDHVDAAMWREFIDRHMPAQLTECGCYVEATSREDVYRLLRGQGFIESYQREPATYLVAADRRDFAVTRFPLYDFLSQLDPARPSVGSIVIWRDVSHELADLRQRQLFNILFAVAAFLVLEGLLAFGLRVISQRLEREIEMKTERIEQLAYFDPLTGLANRTLFHQEMRRAEALVRRGGHAAAVLFVDLDGFKQVNDRLGHEAGDRLLAEVARRLQACVRETDTLARLGGDEFAAVLLLAPAVVPRDVILVAERMLASLAEPVALGDDRARVGASIGVALLNQGCQTLEEGLRLADQAMYQAKKAGKNRWMMADIEEPAAV